MTEFGIVVTVVMVEFVVVVFVVVTEFVVVVIVVVTKFVVVVIVEFVVMGMVVRMESVVIMLTVHVVTVVRGVVIEGIALSAEERTPEMIRTEGRTALVVVTRGRKAMVEVIVTAVLERTLSVTAWRIVLVVTEEFVSLRIVAGIVIRGFVVISALRPQINMAVALSWDPVRH